jgi:hypothetical protein
MEPLPPRWRLRISTLMLLIVIAALLFERWQREREIKRTEAVLQAAPQRVEEEAVRAEAIARQAEQNMALVKALSDQDRPGASVPWTISRQAARRNPVGEDDASSPGSMNSIGVRPTIAESHWQLRVRVPFAGLPG